MLIFSFLYLVVYMFEVDYGVVILHAVIYKPNSTIIISVFTLHEVDER